MNVEENEILAEDDETLRWYNVTHQENYDQTIARRANERLDRLMEGLIDPSKLKKMDPKYAELDSVDRMRERACGAIDAWAEVLALKARARYAFDRMKEAQSEQFHAVQNEEEAQDDLEPTWQDRG